MRLGSGKNRSLWTRYSFLSTQAAVAVVEGDYNKPNNNNPVTVKSHYEHGTQTDPHDFLLAEKRFLETSKPLSEDENNNNWADLNNNNNNNNSSNANSIATGVKVGGNMTVFGSTSTTISATIPIPQNSKHPPPEPGPVPEPEPISEPIKVFPSIELPTPNFCGRGVHLEAIHKRLQSAAGKSRWEERVVLLYGLGGIGKTELTRKYAQVYIKDEIIQNVAWIDAETLGSLNTSFLTLARKLKLPTTPSDTPEQIARRVYEHFSDHVGTGLFIFDNAQQMHEEKNYFGIYKYLPILVLPRLPLVLITSRDKEWELGNRKEALILVDELEDEAAVELLSKRLNLTEGQQNSHQDMKAVRKLAGALQGFPLALTLSPSNIHNAEYTSLPKEIDTYLQRMNAPDGDWALDRQSSGAATKYELIMVNVWRVTLERMEASGNIGKAALQLIYIMGYLPPDTITLQTVQNIFQFMFKEPATNMSFSMLEKYSLITIIKMGQGQSRRGQIQGQNETNKSSSPQIRVHRLVQRITRDTLDRKTESDYSYIMGICEYLSSQQEANSHIIDNLKEYRITLHRHLKDRHWPQRENSILYSYIFLSQVILLKDLSTAWEILEDLHYGFHQSQSLGSRSRSRSRSRSMYAVAEETTVGSFADETNKLSLLNLSLFYFSKQEKYCLNKHFENAAQSKDILARAFLSSAKLYILDLLVQFRQEDASSTISAELGLGLGSHNSRLHTASTQLCGELLRIGLAAFDEDLKTVVGKMILSTVKSKSKEICQLENVEEIFSLMWSYCCHDPNLISPYVGTVCRKHFDIYENLSMDQTSEKESSTLSMAKYWASAGPFKYSNILNYVTWQSQREIELGDLWPETTQKLFVDTFLREGGPAVLAQHLQFLSTDYGVGTDEAQYPLCYCMMFISVLAFQWDCALNFIQAPNLMDALYNLTKKSLSVSRSTSLQKKFCCLMTWFSIFAKKTEVVDSNHVLWSIHRIDKKLLETFLEDIRRGGSIWWNIRYAGILESVVESCENQLALEIAQLLIQILNSELPVFTKANNELSEKNIHTLLTDTDGDTKTS